MTVHDLRGLFEYSYWANETLFGVVSQISPQEFTKRVAGTYGSLRNTLVHALSTEWGWLERCGGLERGPRLEPGSYPRAETLVSDWRRVAAGMREHLARLGDEDLGIAVEYPGAGGVTRSMPRGELLHHAALHGVHYRGQAALLLRELGYTPGHVDFLFYLARTRGVPVW